MHRVALRRFGSWDCRLVVGAPVAAARARVRPSSCCRPAQLIREWTVQLSVWAFASHRRSQSSPAVTLQGKGKFSCQHVLPVLSHTLWFDAAERKGRINWGRACAGAGDCAAGATRAAAGGGTGGGAAAAAHLERVACSAVGVAVAVATAAVTTARVGAWSPVCAAAAARGDECSLGSMEGGGGASAPARQIQPADAYASVRSEGVITSAHVVTLQQRGVVVIDDCLLAAELRDVAAEIQEIRALASTEGGFKDNAQLKEIRSDRVRWLHEDDNTCGELMRALTGTQVLRSAVLLLKGLGAALQVAARPTKPWTLEVPTRCMLSMYGGNGTAYRPHRDNVSGGSFMEDEGGWLADREQADREITAILYLNLGQDTDPWPEENGGALRCYLGAEASDKDGTTATEVLDIAPIGGRLVLFKSREILHEVRPTFVTAGRYALSCWLLQDPLKSSALDFLKTK
eukprot:COSAG02_NODE_7213_length_3115_cov_2.587202_4_plen_459_part_00